MKKIVIIVLIVLIIFLGIWFLVFYPFANGVIEDSKKTYPFNVKINDSTTLIIKEPGKMDTIISDSNR